VLGGIGACLGCTLCQTRLRLSRKVDECQPLAVGRGGQQRGGQWWRGGLTRRRRAHRQGLTFVQFSARRKRFLWDRGCIQGLFRGCLGDIRGYYRVLRVCFISETAQVELNCGGM
jgi:hypothetical protein